MNRRLVAAVLLALGCSRKAPSASQSAQSGKQTPPTPPPAAALARPDTAAALPPMPKYPEANRGNLAVISAGPAGSDTISRNWVAAAGLCNNPARLLVTSDQPASGGTIILLHLPDTNRVTKYPVVMANGGTVSTTGPTATLGVQVYSKTGPLAYQAAEGSVELSSFGPSATGRFAVTLREVTRHDRIQLAGAFRDIPVGTLDSARCAPAATGSSPG
jgi:hypothetical protein